MGEVKKPLIVERDIMGTMHIKLPAHDGGDPFDFIQIQYQHPYTDNQSTKRLANQIAELITGGDNESTDALRAENAELVAALDGLSTPSGLTAYGDALANARDLLAKYRGGTTQPSDKP